MTKGEQLLATLSENVFLRDFIYTDNKTKEGQSLNNTGEFSDLFILMDDLLILFEVKDRNEVEASGPEINWFKNKVMKKAKNQIKTDMHLYQNADQLFLINLRGVKRNIKENEINYWINIIVYLPGHDLATTALDKYYTSSEIGLIHVLPFSDFKAIIDAFPTPMDISRYFLVRKELCERFSQEVSMLSEYHLMATAIHGEVLTKGKTPLVIRPHPSYLDFYFPMRVQHLLKDVRRFLEQIASSFSVVNPEDKDFEKNTITIISSFAKMHVKELLHIEKYIIERENDCKDDIFNSHLNRCSTSVVYDPRLKTIFLLVSISENRDRPFLELFSSRVDYYFYCFGKQFKEATKLVGFALSKDGNGFKSWTCYKEREWRYNEQMEEFLKAYPFADLKTSSGTIYS